MLTTGAWRTGNNLNNTRRMMDQVGTTNISILFGGDGNPPALECVMKIMMELLGQKLRFKMSKNSAFGLGTSNISNSCWRRNSGPGMRRLQIMKIGMVLLGLK